MLTDLVNQLPQFPYARVAFPYGGADGLPLRKAGWSLQQHYSYRLRTDQHGPEVLWERLAGRVRTDLRKADPNEGEIRPIGDPVLFEELYQKLARKRGTKPFFPYAAFKRLFRAAQQRQQAQCWVYYLRDYVPVAAIWLPYDAKSAYLLAAAKDPSVPTERAAMTHLIWHAVQWCVDQGLIFDFEGSSLPGVEEYYRSFGPELTPYLQAVRYRGWRGKLLRGLQSG